MHDALGSKREIERLRLLNVTLNVPNLNAAVEPPAPAPAPAPAAAAADDKDARLVDLEWQLATLRASIPIQQAAWDAEKLVLEGQLSAIVSGSAVMVGGGAPSATDDQTLRIEELSDEVDRWRELYESRTSSTHSNTLHGLLRKLQVVLGLPFDDPDAVYAAVAEAIYAHTTAAQRREISDAPVYKDGFIDYLVNGFKSDSSDAYGSDAEVTDTSNADGIEVTDTSKADGIELTERPKSAQRPPRPESAHGRTQEDAEGNAKQDTSTTYGKIKSFAKKARGYTPFGTSRTADLSTLLSDLKHVSEDDAYAPPI
jgi:hypothetical protein